jgi:ferritin
MKDLLRRKSILTEEVIEVLNKQVKMEAKASASYLAMAGWCDLKGYDNSADFFYTQSNQEREHMLKLYRYLIDMEAQGVAPSIPEVNHEYVSLKHVFETALEQEITVTESVHNIVRVCRDKIDFATEEFMRWFVEEQIEEEYVARRILELFDIFGEDQLALALLDERVPQVEYDKSAYKK